MILVFCGSIFLVSSLLGLSKNNLRYYKYHENVIDDSGLDIQKINNLLVFQRAPHVKASQ